MTHSSEIATETSEPTKTGPNPNPLKPPQQILNPKLKSSQYCEPWEKGKLFALL